MVNIVGVRALVPPQVGGHPSNPKMTARAVLQCRPNSHPFPERNLILDQPVKIGRSVARARPATNNAIFDCKVLSRNHALLWYENGKFYLQDTKSSNGTFVNNQRLSKGSEESAPREVCSGDIVQFGVDVMENSRKVTHGCIVATLKLYMPDGQEAKASPSTVVGGTVTSVTAQELYQLRTYLQESQHREQQIETKLATLQRLVASTQEAVGHSWKAMINEDRLLQRLETLEAQLNTYAKNYPEDSIREEMRRLMEDKSQYELSAKESLRHILQEKLDAVTKLADLERTLSVTEDELTYMKNVSETTQKELLELIEKQTSQNELVTQLNEKLKHAEENLKETEEKFEQEKKELICKLEEKSSEEIKLLARIESLSAEGDITKEQLSAMKAKYENIKNGELSGFLKSDKDAQDLENLSGDASEVKQALEVTQEEIRALKERLQTTQDELSQAQANVSQLKHEAELADTVEAGCLSTRAQLQEELAESRGKEMASTALIHHLQEQIALLEERLNMIDSHVVTRIYDDPNEDDSQSYEDNSQTLVRKKPKTIDDDYEDNYQTLVRKKDSPKSSEEKGKSNEEEKEKEEDKENKMDKDDKEIEPDLHISSGETTPIISTKVDSQDSTNVNGTPDDVSYLDSQLVTLNKDIAKYQDLLAASRLAQKEAEKEVSRVREELAQANRAASTAMHEASNLRQQLAASEASMAEKLNTVSLLENQVSVTKEMQNQVTSIQSKLTEEQSRAKAARDEVEQLKRKLKDADELAGISVAEAEELKERLLVLEERLEMEQHSPATPLILPPGESIRPSGHPLGQGARVEGVHIKGPCEGHSERHMALESLSEGGRAGGTVTGSSSDTVAQDVKSIAKYSSGLTESLSNTEMEALRDTVAKLKDELNKAKEEYNILREKTQKSSKGDISFTDSSYKSHSTVEEVKMLHQVGDSLLLEQLRVLEVERDELKQRLAGVSDDYKVLDVQNKTAVALTVVPLLIVLLGFVTAFYDTVSAVTATTEYSLPS
ncbi:uncharacterized protein LOC143017701 isoform X2 [Oratosquilla oratoria]|uniref:uncharacterized protein LOC143017701 isoform X2 n=1 Tax=Oratosquilla oratoria TaxID=337810 RepID=UPI003F765A09